MILVDYILFSSTLSVVRSLPPFLFESGISSSTTAQDATTTLSAITASTITAYITVTLSASPSSVTSTPTTTTRRPSSFDVSPITTPTSVSMWSMPAQITNIAQDLNITRFGDDQRNLRVVNGIPASASAPSYAEITAPALSSSGSSPSLFIPFVDASDQTWDNSSSVLQTFYPRGSVNPSSNPRGGAQFYASPVDLSATKNVTFAYRVFFPIDFDFVKGGKLPGLYGGHSGCSGGNAALTCFSTRLMWREEGNGELYLYAPKDKQTSDLCSDPHSVCDSAYGLSIGRGTFKFTPGKWTFVSQTVTLNTPGKQDGCLTLAVNGKRVIDRKDIFYRKSVYYPEVMPKSKKSNKTSSSRKQLPQTSVPRPTHTQSPSVVPPPIPYRHKSGGLLGLGLGGILSNGNEDLEPTQDELFIDDGPTYTPTNDDGIGKPFPSNQQSWDSSASDSSLRIFDSESTPGGPVGFAGIFFSTFFGGHRPDWASPRDQYAWFKDFSLTRNA
ncbi:hypothetical protein V5O48_006594 [Marasmius crinis-equi]|uniref:Polysaccharide lyase 14 domain-containing protein n=1 Tax=Marasmius crinis-equi TaxID=585013 RepID=A0ABR3FJA4_9AGAR